MVVGQLNQTADQTVGRLEKIDRHDDGNGPGVVNSLHYPSSFKLG